MNIVTVPWEDTSTASYPVFAGIFLPNGDLLMSLTPFRKHSHEISSPKSTEKYVRPAFQVVGQQHLDRKDHVWYKLGEEHGDHKGRFKCCLCGGVTKTPPPATALDPQGQTWTPEFYSLPLTPEERAMCPNPAAR